MKCDTIYSVLAVVISAAIIFTFVIVLGNQDTYNVKPTVYSSEYIDNHFQLKYRYVADTDSVRESVEVFRLYPTYIYVGDGDPIEGSWNEDKSIFTAVDNDIQFQFTPNELKVHWIESGTVWYYHN